jgi:hypothetical protein
MDLDFNNTTQRLVLKTEYSTNVTEITFNMPAFGGIFYEEVRTFNPSLVTEAEYESFWYSGFSFMFDIVPL